MMCKTKYSGQVVGHNVDGTPIGKEDFLKRAKAASQRVKSGDFVTQEEVEKEIENWHE